MREVKIPLQLLNEILGYLVKRPYEEVAVLVANINNNHQVIKVEPEEKKETK